MKSISKKRFVNFILIIAFIFAFSDYKFSQNVNPCVNLVGKIKTGTSLYDIYFSNNGRWITQGGTKDLRLWDTETGFLFKEYKGSESSGDPVAFSLDDSLIAAGTKGENVQIWEINTGKLLNRFETKYGDITDLAFSPNGNFIASSGSDFRIFGFAKKEKDAKVWEIRTGTLKLSLKPNFINTNSVIFSKISFAVDGKIIAAAFEDKVGFWKTDNGELITYLIDSEGSKEQINKQSSGGIIGEMKFSPNGKLFATTTFYDGRTKLWEVPSGRLFLDTGQNASSIEYSQDNKFIILGGKDNTVRVWSLEEKRQIKLLEGHKRYVKRVSLSADGKLLVTSDSDNTLFWTVADWQNKFTLNKAGYATFSPAGNILATIHSGGLNNTVFLWRIDTDCFNK